MSQPPSAPSEPRPAHRHEPAPIAMRFHYREFAPKDSTRERAGRETSRRGSLALRFRNICHAVPDQRQRKRSLFSRCSVRASQTDTFGRREQSQCESTAVPNITHSMNSKASASSSASLSWVTRPKPPPRPATNPSTISSARRPGETRRSSNSSRTAKPSLRPLETVPAAETAGGQTTSKE